MLVATFPARLASAPLAWAAPRLRRRAAAQRPPLWACSRSFQPAAGQVRPRQAEDVSTSAGPLEMGCSHAAATFCGGRFGSASGWLTGGADQFSVTVQPGSARDNSGSAKRATMAMTQAACRRAAEPGSPAGHKGHHRSEQQDSFDEQCDERRGRLDGRKPSGMVVINSIRNVLFPAPRGSFA